MPDKSDLRIEPLLLEGICDYHVHCDYSIDAVGSIDDYCQAAIKRNLAEICFTTHYDFNPNSDGRVNFINIEGTPKPANIENLEPYVEEVLTKSEEYYLRGLSVKLGVEVGWFSGCEEEVEKINDRYQFDYILCGIHELENECFCCHSSYEKCFNRYDVRKAVEIYYKDAIKAAQSGLFDSIAHLEYYLKYGEMFYGNAIYETFEGYLDELFQALKKTGTGLEINTAAIRHGLKEYYPRMNVINLAKKSGVKVLKLGSDSHKPEQLGFEFEVAASLIPSTIVEDEG